MRKKLVVRSLAWAGEPLLEPIRRAVRERVTVMPVDHVEVVQSQFGDITFVTVTFSKLPLDFGKYF
jgi:hypothetical protein